MKELHFEVTLKTDIILNQKAASEGPNETLDFIPGNNFLGIVAGALYAKVSPAEAMDLFHNGMVRFGDAHLASASGARSLKVPAAMYYPKKSSPDQEAYIFHHTPETIRQEKQLKQCRNGFYDFTSDDQVAIPCDIRTNFAIKSAHDRDHRTSKDEKMYGYESLQAGAKLLFTVEIDKEELSDKIIQALTDEKIAKRVGRSRTAQYGLVEIKHLQDKPYAEVKSNSKSGTVTVYADSRLIFIDEETGLPTFQPCVEQLGFASGTINWEKSQIRTFQYTPWNFKRQCFDADRCGIEKGSVFVIDNVTECPAESQYIGSYRNEGFGKVIYNPDFLTASGYDGKTAWTLQSNKKEERQVPSKERLQACQTDSPLLANLKRQHNEAIEELAIFEMVNDWVTAHESIFKGKSFASQWGTIRSIATRRLMAGGVSEGFETLKDELFHEDKENKERCGYLMHGVAESSWGERGRRKAFKSFIENQLGNLPEEKICLAVINLAAEMAKKRNNNE